MGAHIGHPMPAWVWTAVFTAGEISFNHWQPLSNFSSARFHLFLLRSAWVSRTTPRTRSMEVAPVKQVVNSVVWTVFKRAVTRWTAACSLGDLDGH